MERVAKRSTKKEVMGLMEPLIADWFNGKFNDLTEPQSYAIPIIHRREHVLVSSPTGSGKTMTAFLSIINELFKYAKAGKLEEKIYAVYVSPLKALANDINRNLEEPLREIKALAEKEGVEIPKIRVGVRSGDTSQYERQKMLVHPPHILITTPESLALSLAAPKFREKFAGVEYAIIDEIHEICDSKRGVFLSLTLERLQEQVRRPFTRIGLSATLAPIEQIAKFLVGYNGDGSERDVNLVEVQTRKTLDLKVLCPTEDMTALSYEIVNAKMYDMLKELIEAHRTTIVFTNTRSGTEHVVYKLKERGIESIEAHHGSLSKETRLDVEERLKRGELRCVVSSTSLELGIDIGFVDLVCQIGSPKSVAKGMQRIGRSGHSHGKTAKGRMIVFDTDDLVECAVLCRAAHRSNIDRVSIPKDCLDVLSQALVGMSIEKRWEVEEAFRLVRRSYCYRDLPEDSFRNVLRYLGSKEGFEGVYSKIWYDEAEARFGKKKGSRMIYFLNLGTIPEEASYSVLSERGALIGDLSEKFVERLAPRDVFVLGGRSYEFVRSKGMKVFVKSASGRKPTVPSWTGEMLPRSFDLSVEIAKFRRELGARLDDEDDKIIEWLCRDFDIDYGSARSILSYFREQRAAVETIPNDRMLAVEGYLDRTGNSNIVFHFPFGRRVNDALSRAYAFQVTQRFGCNVSVSVVDDAFMLSIPRQVNLREVEGMVTSDQLEPILRKAVKDSEIFKQRFRHTAARSFMILRNYKGREVSVNRQQVRSGFLLDYLTNLEHVPVIEETYREILEDVMDVTNAKVVLDQLERNETGLTTIDFSSTPSPFAHNVILAGISDIVLMEDRSSLLKELHRKVLSRAMEGDLDRFEFEEVPVAAYFRRKIGRVEAKEDIVPLLRRAGPLHIFKERGRSVYPYATPDKQTVDAWAIELLAAGQIASVYIDDVYFVAADDLPAYQALLRRQRDLSGDDQKMLDALAEPLSANELAQRMNVDIDKALRSLHLLETTQAVGRVDRKDGRWRYARREVPPIPRDVALDQAVSTYLGCFAPASVDEIAFALGLPEDEVRRTARALVEEGAVDEGRFVVSEHEQYMLKLDHLRLKGGNQRAYDHRTVDAYRRSKTNGPFDSIEACLSFLGEAGMPLDIYRRVKGFDERRWEELRRSGRVLLGRFMRGRVRYVLSEDASLFVAAYRQSALSTQDQRILDVLTSYGGLSMRQLVGVLGVEKEEIRESMDRLDRNMFVVRRFEEGEEWSRENFYLPFEPKPFGGDPYRTIVERFLKAYGPVPLQAISSYSGLPASQVRHYLYQMPTESITVGEGQMEMFLFAEELPRLDTFRPGPEGVSAVSLYDPAVQPLWAEIASRYGDGWVFPILSEGRLVGAAEKWNMSGCIEIRSLDLDDPTLLPEALKALDDMMSFYRLTGFDIIRLREVLGKAVGEMPEDVVEELEGAGYRRVDHIYAKGRLIFKQMSREQVLGYVFNRARVLRSRRYDNVIAAVKRIGGLRSDSEASLRVKVHVPLRKLHEQGMLVRAVGVPEFVTYTTPEFAALFRKAKERELTRDMRALLEAVREEGAVSRRRIYDLSLVGHRHTYDAVRALFQGTLIYLDGSGRIRPVADLEKTAREARKEVFLLLFRTYGIFSAENLSRFLKSEWPMREIRGVLAELEDEGFLVKGYLVQGDEQLHWMLSDDAGKDWAAPEEAFVLSPDDNLSYFLYNLIKSKCPLSWRHVIFRGADIAGSFKGRKKGNALYVSEIEGGAEAKRLLAEYVRRVGMTIRDAKSAETPEWELQEFYEKTHPGEV